MIAANINAHLYEFILFYALLIIQLIFAMHQFRDYLDWLQEPTTEDLMNGRVTGKRVSGKASKQYVSPFPK
jgi:hypothetical protein